MTIAEILDQAKALSPQERKELAKLLIDTLEVVSEPQANELESWGQPLKHQPDELKLNNLPASDNENPIGWVKMKRENLDRKGVGDWGE
jgi:hypothetical protein